MPERLLSASTAGHGPMAQAVSAVMISAFYGEVQNVFYGLRWALAFIVVLIVTDFWSGLAASVKVRGEDFRLSRALRRTIAKFCEYLSFIIFATVLAKSILEPLGICNYIVGGAIGAAAALFCEADSIYGHICDLHGLRSPFSVKRFVIAYLKRKNEDVGQAVEEALETDNTINTQKDETDKDNGRAG